MLQRAGLDTEKLLLCQPDSGEMALEVVDQSVRSSAVDIICVDSVAALVPRSEIEGEMGATQGAHVSLLGRGGWGGVWGGDRVSMHKVSNAVGGRPPGSWGPGPGKVGSLDWVPRCSCVTLGGEWGTD